MVDRSLGDAGAARESLPAESRVLSPTSVSLSKGGRAIRGIGEKFAASPVTGTGILSVPIATSPGRSGFGPRLSLSYDSGSGNGPFGFGWRLSLPAITRKTDLGLPRYEDAMPPTTRGQAGGPRGGRVTTTSSPSPFVTAGPQACRPPRYRPALSCPHPRPALQDCGPLMRTVSREFEGLSRQVGRQRGISERSPILAFWRLSWWKESQSKANDQGAR
ncbi:SpvB/TcaC N-terminal domain-containing protein [Streptomyces sp. NPDC002088]|uniref:SpvB/TcaC N-terminal domain-containing protein n=1 Tax=Streptomyces sp. NPDC002088 TaxID=3154665 RepID=UPI00332D823A